ncbi:MAG: glycosyltransferase family 2 protein [Chloroflexota bacterium]|nr:glycosyltransferase family 2 protein [Chloroflexota bacterium]
MVSRSSNNVNGTADGSSSDGSKGRKPRVVVVMPAYNAARTLAKTHGDLPKDIVDKVILVDDASQDDTASIARQLGLDVIVHVQNKGYGGNQKTCYIEALNQGADIVVMLHPDNQYDATRIPTMIAPILEGKADLVLGSRLLNGRSATLQGGMPLWKYVSNRFLTIVENFALGTNLSEAHTGFRAYSRRLLTTIPFLLNSDDFVFDSEVIAQTVAFGFKIAEVPVPTRYFPEASSVNFRRSVIYGLATLNVSRKVWLHRKGIRRYPIFRKRLANVLSREYKDRIFGAESLTGSTKAGTRS